MNDSDVYRNNRANSALLVSGSPAHVEVISPGFRAGTALLVSGSPAGVSPDILRDLTQYVGFILALDAGGEHLAKAGILPDLLLGDLDSISEDTLTLFEAKGVPVQAYDAHKNATDIELGIKELSVRGFRRVIATSVSGGRTDHALGSLGALANAAHTMGMQVVLRDEHETCFFVSSNTQEKVLELHFRDNILVGATSFPAGQASSLQPLIQPPLQPPLQPSLQPPLLPLAFPAYVSLIAWGSPVTVSIMGTEWLLNHHTLTPYSALGVSNLLRSPVLRLEVHEGEGTVLLFLSH